MSEPERDGEDVAAFERERPHLLALAYRMLGDMGRAEELVQDTWLRWSGRERSEAIDSTRAYLVTIVTRLCLNELASAHRQREEARGDRLPEPVDLEGGGLDRLETLERVSMAFLVALQRLTPAERAVLLLHDVFDFDHPQIAGLVGKSHAACRKLLERARESVREEKRFIEVPREAHARLLDAFLRAAYAGDAGALASMLAEDAVLVTDGGERGRDAGGLRNLGAPLRGAKHVAAFVTATSKRGLVSLEPEIRDLNGVPGIVLRSAGGPFAAITFGVDGTRIHRIYFHADLARLGHVGAPRKR